MIYVAVAAAATQALMVFTPHVDASKRRALGKNARR